MNCNALRAGLRSAAIAAICLYALWTQSACLAAVITLAWDAGASATAGYAVYCGETSRAYSSRNDVGVTTTIKVDGLLEGMTYYCSVTAYDVSKVESNYSNEVSATIPYAAPTVAFNASPTTGTAPTGVTFSNTTTGEVTTWAWNFGDGTTGTEKSPTHVYSTPGDYWVTLTATGPGGTAAKTLGTAIKITTTTTTTTSSKGKGPKWRR
jgi:PKD repeat protein